MRSGPPPSTPPHPERNRHRDGDEGGPPSLLSTPGQQARVADLRRGATPDWQLTDHQLAQRWNWPTDLGPFDLAVWAALRRADAWLLHLTLNEEFHGSAYGPWRPSKLRGILT